MILTSSSICVIQWVLYSVIFIGTSTATNIELPGGLQKPITDVKADEEVKYLIMFDLPSDNVTIVETYVKDTKENLAIARGDLSVRGEDELKAKKGKEEKEQGR